MGKTAMSVVETRTRKLIRTSKECSGEERFTHETDIEKPEGAKQKGVSDL